MPLLSSLRRTHTGQRDASERQVSVLVDGGGAGPGAFELPRDTVRAATGASELMPVAAEIGHARDVVAPRLSWSPALTSSASVAVTPRQMRLANALARLVEVTGEGA